MVEFLSLYLGLVWGVQPVRLRVEAPVTQVEIRLDGAELAFLTDPPWAVDVDLGEGPMPALLEAIGRDAEGEVVARSRQVLNLPRPEAAARVELVERPEGRLARLTWQSVTGESPASVEVRLDGRRLPVGDPAAIALPELDEGELHILEAVLEFPDGTRARAHESFGARFAESTQSGLTSLPIQVEGKTDLREIRDWFVDSGAEGAALLPVAIDRGGAEILVVRDREAKVELEAAGLQAYIPRSHLRDRWTRVRYLQGQTELGNEHRFFFVNPQSVAVEQATFTSELFGRSPPLSSEESSLFWAATRVDWGREEAPQRLADAVAVAGLQAVRHQGRRAVVLILSPAGRDASSLSPLAARRFLRALHVPLFVWRVGGEEGAKDDWGEGEALADHRAFQGAVHALGRNLDEQVVVWLDGIHLPQRVSLSPSASRAVFSTAPLRELAATGGAPASYVSPQEFLRIRLNEARAELGRASLRGAPTLDRVAESLASAWAGGRGPEAPALDDEDLLPLLEAAGYEAAVAASNVLLGALPPEEAVATWAASGGRDRNVAFDPRILDLGVAIRSRGPAQVTAAVFALSEDDAFRRETSALRGTAEVCGDLLERINQERSSRKRGPLFLDPLLTKVAQVYAEAMLEGSFYGHYAPDGSDVADRARRVGYPFERVGENLAEGPRSAREVVEAWLGSAPHRRNVLDPRFEETGFGIAVGENANGKQVLWVQVLGRPRPR